MTPIVLPLESVNVSGVSAILRKFCCPKILQRNLLTNVNSISKQIQKLLNWLSCFNFSSFDTHIYLTGVFNHDSADTLFKNNLIESNNDQQLTYNVTI